MTYDTIITINIEGIDVEFEVDYHKTTGELPVYGKEPEKCSEGSPDEYEITSLYLIDGKNKLHNAYFLVPLVKDVVIRKIKEVESEVTNL